MNHLKRRSLCKSCRVCFIRDGETQVYCHSCLSDSLYQTSNLGEYGAKKRTQCLICSSLFTPKKSRSTCSDICKLELENRNHKSQSNQGYPGIPKGPKEWDYKSKSSELKRPEHSSKFIVKHSKSSLYFKRSGEVKG